MERRYIVCNIVFRGEKFDDGRKGKRKQLRGGRKYLERPDRSESERETKKERESRPHALRNRNTLID